MFFKEHEKQCGFDLGDDTSRLMHLIDVQKVAFVDIQLSKHFSNLVDFVRVTDKHKDIIKSKEGTLPGGVDPRTSFKIDYFFTLQTEVLYSVTKAFNSNWKQGIHAIATDTRNLFSNFKLGSEILKQV